MSAVVLRFASGKEDKYSFSKFLTKEYKNRWLILRTISPVKNPTVVGVPTPTWLLGTDLKSIEE